MNWEIVIGIETHVQLITNSKIFSNAPTSFGANPNSQACAVDLALPGVLPVLNKNAVRQAIKFGLAVGSQITGRSIFARKNYFYPDLPKGYQISQFDKPILCGGELIIPLDSDNKIFFKKIKLTRAHLEEDAGKSIHGNFNGMTGIDLNRAGMPLLEVVSEPDIRSSSEAVMFAKSLHSLVVWLDICDGNMQEGSFRCDANVSVRLKGEKKFRKRCEIKNLNSFRFLEEAINFEISRQIEIYESGGMINQETRLYDSEKKITRSMRNKEDSMDYRYFPDPDLPPLIIKQDFIDLIKSEMPELPDQKRKKFTEKYNISEYDAIKLTHNKLMANYFEAIMEEIDVNHSKLVVNWLFGQISSLTKFGGIKPVPIKPNQIVLLFKRILDKTISERIAKEVLSEMWISTSNSITLADEIIKSKNLQQISDNSTLERVIDKIILQNKKSVEEYKKGKTKALNSLLGKVMMLTKGKANPVELNKLLKKKLD